MQLLELILNQTKSTYSKKHILPLKNSSFIRLDTRLIQQILTIPRISGANGIVGHMLLYIIKNTNHEEILPHMAICVS